MLNKINKFIKKIINYFFPAPILSIGLCVLWLLLNRSISNVHILLGLILGFIIPIFTRGLRPLPVKLSSPKSIIKLIYTVFLDTSKSNLNVIRILLTTKSKVYSDFVYIPLKMRDPNALAVLSIITCITPGTSWAEIAFDRSGLLLHVLELHSEEETIKNIQNYEKLLMEIFE